uniref:Uncharacterized protein n=1 Tax=Rhizophora mucronata TaxID=61149 RepID=A0A2P2N584_RHIMU
MNVEKPKTHTIFVQIRPKTSVAQRLKMTRQKWSYKLTSQ